MNFEIWQIALITIYSFMGTPMDYTMSYAITRPVTAGLIIGLIMGDVGTGMFIGGTLELMVLGVGSFGGASIPDYFTATIIGTALSIAGGLTPEQGVALSIPVALLMLQLDVVAKIINSLLVQKAKKYASLGDFKGIARMNVAGFISFGLTRAIPTFIALWIGADLITKLIEMIPKNIMSGLNIAAGLLPVVGIAILMRYLPIKKYSMYYVLGFLFSTIFNLNLLMVTIIAVIIASIMYQQEKDLKITQVANNNPITNEGWDIDD